MQMQRSINMKNIYIILFTVLMFPIGMNAQEQDTLKAAVEVIAETVL